MPQRIDRNTRGEIEILPPVCVPDGAPLPAREYELWARIYGQYEVRCLRECFLGFGGL